MGRLSNADTFMRVICYTVLFISMGSFVLATQGTFDATSLDAYLRQAQSANPEVHASMARYRAALQRVPQAASLPDPMLQVTHFIESVQTRTGPQENIIMLSQRLPWFGKLDTKEQIAVTEAEVLWNAYQSKRLKIARQVATDYFDYGFVGKAIALTRENLGWLTKLEPIIEEKVRGGGDINPLLRIKVEQGKVADKLASLEQQKQIVSARLRSLLAVGGKDILPLPELERPEALSPDAAILIQAVRRNNPRLLMTAGKVKSAELRQKLAGLASYPDFTVGFNYIQIGDPEVNPNTPDAGSDPWGVTASMNIPLWFDKNEATRAEATAGIRAEKNTYADQLNVLEAEIHSSLARLDDANRRLQLYGDELLGLAEQAADNSRVSYESGRTGILEVIDSERSLLDLQLLSWQAAADAWKQRVILETLANLSLDEDMSPEVQNE
ncbi:TolC family protein [Desulfogranum japonicum]|uniref:TolC family protein n=1 Tax=Desulfogranum japonicum TaxID=231447 RepID=UPI0004092251|nr:TolC family protein [Desulfogranum japonicum]